MRHAPRGVLHVQMALYPACHVLMAGQKAAAVAHTILIIAYQFLNRRQPYQRYGSTCFEERERAAIARRSVRRLEQLGFQVTVHAAGEVV